MATVATDFNLQFTHFCNNPFWYCSHCGFRNNYRQKRCPSCFKLKIHSNKNKPIVVLDIDETLIASKDKNDKEISKEYLNDFVDQHANKLGAQYQQTICDTDSIDHLKVDFDGSPPPKLSPSIASSTKSAKSDFEKFHKDIHNGENMDTNDDYIGLSDYEHKLNDDDDLTPFQLESSREPNPNRYLSPIKRCKRRSSRVVRRQSMRTELEPLQSNGENVTPKKPEHRTRATIDISHFITKNDVYEYEPMKNIKKDMVYKSLTTNGKYYYIYFRSGAKKFLETLIGWKLCGHIQLCIMTAANKYYAKSILSKLLNCSKFENYFDCIISKEHLPFIRVQTKKTSSNIEEESMASDKYRRIKTLDIIYEQLDCDRSVKCIMIDDNLRNFDVHDKLMYVYNIVEYRNPLEARDRYLDNKLQGALRYIESIVIHKLNRNELIESELNNGYKQYLLHQSDDSLKEKIQRLQERGDVDIQHRLLYHILLKKTETLHKKIKIVHEFVKKERVLQGNTHPMNRNTAKYLDRLLSAINIASFEYLDRYLMSGLIRIKKNDANAFKSECELLATIVLFYRLYFVISNNQNTMKYFCSNFNAFLYNLYCCNVLIRYHLCNFDGKQFMRECMQIFAGLTVVGADKRQKENINNNDDIVVDIQKKFGKKIFYHYLQNVMYYVDPPYVFDSMFDKAKIMHLLPSKYRANEKYTPYIANQSQFFKVFEKYTSTLSVFIYKAFNSKILR
eukprot:236700_1